MNKIGKQIQALRKQKGITQMELANAVGVTTQAVSKWENGGTPDALILPNIADCFDVTIDCLFGRGDKQTVALPSYVYQKIHKLPLSERTDAIYQVCLSLIHACGSDEDIADIMETIKMFDKNDFSIAYQVITDELMCTLSLLKQNQFCMILPEPKEGYLAAFLSIEEYQNLFTFLGTGFALQIMIEIYRLPNCKGFTIGLLAKKCKLSTSDVKACVESMVGRGWIEPILVETSQDDVTAYVMNPYMMFIPFMLTAERFANPMSFGYAIISREKPILYHNESKDEKTTN